MALVLSCLLLCKSLFFETGRELSKKDCLCIENGEGDKVPKSSFPAVEIKRHRKITVIYTEEE